VQARISAEESVACRPFTMHVVQAFIDGLSAEGGPCAHYVDQIRASLGDSLD
jgi:hypothetical protein